MAYPIRVLRKSRNKRYCIWRTTWYEKDRSYTWQRYLETSALLDSMKLINRTLNQKAQPKGVKVGSKVLHPFIVDLYRQTGRNLLSTDGIAPDEVKVSIPSIFTNIDQLKSQPCAEGGQYGRLRSPIRGSQGTT